VVDAVCVETYAFLFFVGNGVVETYALDEAAVTTGAGGGFDSGEERGGVFAPASQTDNYHFESF